MSKTINKRPFVVGQIINGKKIKEIQRPGEYLIFFEDGTLEIYNLNGTKK